MSDTATTPDRPLEPALRPVPLREAELEPPPRRDTAPEMRRRDVYPRPVVDGRELRDGPLHALRTRARALLATRGERDEAELEARLAEAGALTRTNVVAMVSPKGGVGKTTATFLVGNLLAGHLKLRALAVDANPDFGTLARLAPDRARTAQSLADLLDDLDLIRTAAELRPYVSRMATGLHVLGAPRDAEVMARITPGDYAKLLEFLAQWYEVILLDLGTGVAGEFAQWALGRADQAVLVTTPEWVTADVVSDAVRHLPRERTTLLLNQAGGRRAGDERAIEAHFRSQALGLDHRIAIPLDPQLKTMLDSGTYSLEALSRPTRIPLKRLGLAVARGLA
jgi:MinD-like ATPase involved in chromosome partitioning or flagellar assembly